MPIRMVDDENQSSQNDIPSRGRGGGGNSGGGGKGGRIVYILLSLLGLFTLPLSTGIIKSMFLNFFGGGSAINNIASFATGCDMKQSIYDEAAVYEPLAYNDKNPLPESVSLQKYCPEIMNQGQQGSCVAWSSAYAARTILESQRTGQDPNSVRFSPSFLYNQIKLNEECQGSYIQYAMDYMQNKGAVPFSKFAYNDEDCQKQPDATLQSMAQNYKTKGFTRLTMDGDEYTPDLNAMRQHISQGSPVVIGMMVGGSFMREMEGQKVWIPNQEDYGMSGFGGHAMCIVGYDDNLEGGSFQIMNSWGKNWGENGFGWVRYNDFKYFAKEAYGVWPMGKVADAKADKYAVSFGIVNNKDNSYITLKKTGENNFETISKVPVGTKFKVEVTNSIECYTYIFGQETDGSSYVLFPYTPKHSPYCGITGTRLFPKDKSMMVDDKGTKDFITVVFTKSPIDFNKLNEAINKSSKSTYADKFKDALDGELIQNVQYTADKKINFETSVNGGNAVLINIAVNK